jgi:hypothetical protein
MCGTLFLSTKLRTILRTASCSSVKAKFIIVGCLLFGG